MIKNLNIGHVFTTKSKINKIKFIKNQSLN